MSVPVTRFPSITYWDVVLETSQDPKLEVLVLGLEVLVLVSVSERKVLVLVSKVSLVFLTHDMWYHRYNHVVTVSANLDPWCVAPRL